MTHDDPAGPQRLREGDDAVGELLRTARTERPSAGPRAVALAGLLAVGTEGVAGASTLGALTKAAVHLGVFKVLATGAIAVGAGAGLIPLLQTDNHSTSSHAVASAQRVPVTPKFIDAGVPQELQAPVPEAPELPLPVVTPSPLPSAHAGFSHQRDDALGEQLALLRSARSHLLQGNSGAAQRDLTRFGQRYSNSALSQEFEVLQIDTWRQAGATERAKMAARDLLQRRPSSPYAKRLRAILDSAADSLAE